MRILTALLILLAATAAVFSQIIPGGNPDSFQVDASLVTVDASVVDSQGKAVTNLRVEDFSVLDDGELQTIRHFGPATTPYNVLLLLDCSESTRDRLGLLMDAMIRFAGQLRAGDRTEVASFGEGVHVRLGWNADKKKNTDFGSDPICQGTDFYGALNWGVKELHDVTGRRGAIVFSDGLQTEIARKEMIVNGNKVQRIVPPEEDREFQKVLKKVREGGVPFYFVAVDTDLNPGRGYTGPVPDLRQVRERMEKLAEESGGSIVFPKESKDVVPMFLEIGRKLGTSYSIAYRPPHTKDGKHHTIEIRVSGNYLVQQSRSGYTAN